MIRTIGIFVGCGLCVLAAMLVEILAQIVFRSGFKPQGKTMMRWADRLWDTALQVEIRD